MGGNRARGALATLALSTVVLVAVVLAGNVSLPPAPDTPTTQDDTTDRGSFEVVDDVVIPGAEPESEPDDGDAADQTDAEDDGDVEVAVAPGTDDGAGSIPPTPFGPDLPDLTPSGEDPDPPVGPVPPPNVPGFGEPPIIVNPDPPDRPTTGNPDGDIDGKGRGKKGRGAAKGPRRNPHKDKGPRAGHQPRPGNGPRWRPKAPARQDHPNKAGKWSRAEPHPRQSEASDSARRGHSAKKDSGRRPRASAVNHRRGNGKGHAHGHRNGRGRGRR